MEGNEMTEVLAVLGNKSPILGTELLAGQAQFSPEGAQERGRPTLRQAKSYSRKRSEAYKQIISIKNIRLANSGLIIIFSSVVQIQEVNEPDEKGSQRSNLKIIKMQ